MMGRPIVIIVVFAAFACSDGGTQNNGNLWNNLRVKWSLFGPFGGFYSLPRTAMKASRQGYVTPPEETTINTDIKILCPNNDPTICLLFDTHGSIAGMEIGVVRARVNKTRYPFERHPMFQPKIRFGFDVYVTTLFFVEQDLLKTGGRSNTNGKTGAGLWLQNGIGRNLLFEIPRLERDIKKTAYVKELCIPTMGTHYYYNMSRNLPCEDINPIFGLYQGGEMLGFGYQMIGSTKPLGKTTWFEEIPVVAREPRIAIPNAPACLVNGVKKYGILSIHVYFIDNPYFITCLF